MTVITSIGNRLKEAREKKSITLDEVHAKIKIHPRIIQILEEEKFEKLPSPLYAKSFLRNYAEFLEVNTEEILDAYEKQGKKEPAQVELYLKTADEKTREAKGPQSAATIAVFVVVAFLGGGALFYVSRHFNAWAHRSVKKTAAHQTLSKEAAAPAQTARASGEWLRSVEEGNFPKINPHHSLDLKIKALDNVWLHVTCDGKVLFQSILKKGATESWSANKSIQVWTGNPSSMSLGLNNYALGSPGKGLVRKMTITHEGVKATGP